MHSTGKEDGMTRNGRARTGIMLVITTLMSVSACTKLPPLPDNPTAAQQCRHDAARKRQQCSRVCPVWLVLWPACHAVCSSDADRIERECRAYEFEAEGHPTRVEADITTRHAPPQ